MENPRSPAKGRLPYQHLSNGIVMAKCQLWKRHVLFSCKFYKCNKMHCSSRISSTFFFLFMHCLCLLYIYILPVIRSMLPSQVSNKTTSKMWVSQLLQYAIVSYLVCTHVSEFCQTLFNTECRSLLPPVGTVHRWILRWLSTRCKVVDFKNAKRWFITFHDDSEATSLRITISQII